MNTVSEPTAVGIGDSIRNALAAEFPPELLSEIDSPWNNGVKLTVVQPEAVIRRLNDVFRGDVDFEIVKTEFVGTTAATATVRIRGHVWTQDPSGAWHRIWTCRDGFGSVALRRQRNGDFIDLGYDMKSAVTDAIKLAAKLFGVALYLYERKSQTATQPQGSPGSTLPQNTSMQGQGGQSGDQVQKFQIDKINKYFSDCNVPTRQWCEKYGIRDPAGLASYPELVEALISGTHPDVVWCEQQTGNRINGGIRGTNAK